MARGSRTRIGGLALLFALLLTDRASAPPPPLAEILDLPPGPAWLVVFQPADCEMRRRAIIEQIVDLNAIPVVLYADEIPSADLGRLLGPEASEVEVRRLPDVGLEEAMRDRGVVSTPFVVLLDEDGLIENVISDIGGLEE